MVVGFATWSQGLAVRNGRRCLRWRGRSSPRVCPGCVLWYVMRVRNQRQKTERFRKTNGQVLSQTQVVPVLALAEDQAGQIGAINLPVAKAVSSSSSMPIPIAFVAGSLETHPPPGVGFAFGTENQGHRGLSFAPVKPRLLLLNPAGSPLVASATRSEAHLRSCSASGN